MKAVQYDEFFGPLRIVDAPEPVLPPHGAVIDVRAAGLCRSDWHGWQGHDADITPPQIPGHEWAGVVAKVGSEVTRWSGGERVTAPFVCACGSCSWCARGDQQVCERQTQPGFTHGGAFAERLAVDHADVNLVPLPQDVDFVTAASLGLPLRDGVPRRVPTGSPFARRMGRRSRVRRSWAIGDHGRRRGWGSGRRSRCFGAGAAIGS